MGLFSDARAARRVLASGALFLCLSLSGCLGGDAGPTLEANSCRAPECGPQPDPTQYDLRIEGVVQDAAFRPVSGALLEIASGPHTTSAADGTFRFPTMDQGLYVVQVTAQGYLPASFVVRPEDAQPAGTGLVRVDTIVFLDPEPSAQPFVETIHLRGHLQCAHEALIISGSCDVLMDYVNDATEDAVGRLLPEPFDDEADVDFSTGESWQTLVLDVAFEGEDHPGLDGLRLVLQGASDNSALNEYNQFGRWHAPQSFTARVEPNGTYAGGVVSVPDDQRLWRAQILPHSHGYHAVCDPGQQNCFLGAGLAVDVAFEVAISTWYNAPAPEGWSLLP